VPIDYVFLKPNAFVHPTTAQALEQADAIVIGPGDLYTSVIANLVVDGVSAAIRRSSAKKVYICNLMTKRGESDGFKASDFLREISSYLGAQNALDCLIVNNAPLPEKVLQRYARERSFPVEFDEAECKRLVPGVLATDLLAVGQFVRHDSQRLADAVMRVLTED